MSPITTSLTLAIAAVTASTLLLSTSFAIPTLWAYLPSIMVYTFLIMGKDKLAAKGKRGRTPEVTLFLLALAGGTPSILAGQWLFKHKSSKPSFIAGLVGVFALQLVGAYLYFKPF